MGAMITSGIFVGLSLVPASDVPLVLNLASVARTAQFHVVFDDLYFCFFSCEGK